MPASDRIRSHGYNPWFMAPDPSRTFGGDFKRFFGRGLGVLLPSVLTLWILVKAYQFVDLTIAQPINAGVRAGIVEVAENWKPMGDFFGPDSEEVILEIDLRKSERGASTEPEIVEKDLLRASVNRWWTTWALYLDWIGILVAVLAVYFAGRLLGGFLGRRVQRGVEHIITSVPIFKQVYPYVKQVVDFLFSDDKPIQFNRVVVVEYPRKGIWSVGLVTGSTMKSIEDSSGEAVTIFIPSSPTPFTGYTITVPRSEIRELPISIDEALRFTISGGVLVPPHETLPDRDDDPTNPDPSGDRILPKEEPGSS
ncbi:MAG: hypothetical protein CMJ23_10550 [Phycisphaerae bacterium]|nr:hypothetical protein [Phycisphaerae bacterium]